MADEWGVPEVHDWWLPDINACPPVVRSVQAFMEDRLPQAEGESRSEDRRKIEGVFSELNLQENPKLKEESDSVRARTLWNSPLPEVDMQDQAHESFRTEVNVEMQLEFHE